MYNLNRSMAVTWVAASIMLSACGGSGGGSAPVANAPSSTAETPVSSPQPAEPVVGGYCAAMNVDFSESPSPRVTDMPGSLQRLVHTTGEPPVSLFSQLELGARSQAIQNSEVIPRGDGFATIHGNVINNDQVDLIIPGNLDLQWTVEDNLYQPEGVTAGEHGYYGTHVFPVSGTDIDFSMIALDQDSGARKWVVRPGQIGQGGTPLILNDPESGAKVVYSGGLRGIFSLNEDGRVNWCTNTGFGIDSDATSDFDTHIKRRLWGLNYHQPTDSVIAVYGDGTVLAFSRETGNLRARTRIDGDPSVDSTGLDLPAPILEGAEKAIRRQFLPEGATVPDDAEIYQTIVAVALGGGMVVSNYYATDPDSDRIWIAATLPDGADGQEDGEARFGALHSITLQEQDDEYRFGEDCAVPFEGGSASTPAVLPGGERIYTSDNDGHALAFNRQCELIWSVDVGDQILGSLAVSPYDGYVYAATGSGVFQIIDKGSTGELGWSADLDSVFLGGPLLLSIAERLTNALAAVGLEAPVELQASNIQIASLSENALVLMAGLGVQMDPDRSEVFAPLVMSVTTIDRMSGDVINSTSAREESIAVIGVDNDGSVLIGNSPLRRAGLVGITEVVGDGLLSTALSDLIPPLTGGVSKYAPASHYDHAARDAVCYSARKVLVWELNQGKAGYPWSQSPEATAFAALTEQAQGLLGQALAAGELPESTYSEARFAITDAQHQVALGEYRKGYSLLSEACQALD